MPNLNNGMNTKLVYSYLFHMLKVSAEPIEYLLTYVRTPNKS